MTNEQIGMVIYVARTDKRLSGIALGKMVGVSQPIISRIESGQLRVSERIRPRLEAALGLPNGRLRRKH